jgi:hypothetical protein
MATKPPDGVPCSYTREQFHCLHPDARHEHLFQPVRDRERGVYVVPEGVEVHAAVRNLTWDDGMPHCKECGRRIAQHRSSVQDNRPEAPCNLCKKSSRGFRQVHCSNEHSCIVVVCISCSLELFWQIATIPDFVNPPCPLYCGSTLVPSEPWLPGEVRQFLGNQQAPAGLVLPRLAAPKEEL